MSPRGRFSKTHLLSLTPSVCRTAVFSVKPTFLSPDQHQYRQPPAPDQETAANFQQSLRPPHPSCQERAQAARNLMQQLEWAQQERRLRERIVMVHAELRRVASLHLS